MKGGSTMDSTIEVYNDLMKAKEQEAFFKSKGETAPDPVSSVTEAKEKLEQAEAEPYRKG